MRHALVPLGLALAAVVVPAHAQTASPEVTSLAFPLALTTTLERSSETGCSQSFASEDGAARVTLAIDATGGTTLSLEGSYGMTSGPSRGEYAAGDHEFSHIREVHRSTWTGRTSALPDGLIITIDQVSAAEMRTSGYGTLPLPAPTSQGFVAQLRCHVERAEVLPAVATAGERATTLPLLRCAWTGTVPSPFDRYTDAAPFALGSGSGVHDRVEDPMWGATPGHVVRLAP